VKICFIVSITELWSLVDEPWRFGGTCYLSNSNSRRWMLRCVVATEAAIFSAALKWPARIKCCHDGRTEIETWLQPCIMTTFSLQTDVLWGFALFLFVPLKFLGRFLLCIRREPIMNQLFVYIREMANKLAQGVMNFASKISCSNSCGNTYCSQFICGFSLFLQAIIRTVS
jgi:hypothetical protein